MRGEDSCKAKGFEFAAYPSDVDCDRIGLRFKVNAPDIGEQLAAANAHTGLLSKAPEKLEFSRVEPDPAIIDPPIAMEKIKRHFARLSKARDQRILIGKERSCSRIHRLPPARIE